MTAKSFMEEYANSKSELVGIPGFTMNAPLVVNKKADIGIEIEVEGLRLPNAGHLEKIVGSKTKTTWTVKTDGSLRNGGLEYVLTNPCKPEEVDELLKGLYETFGTMRTKLDLSNRCSTHVHINQSGRKINTLTSIIALWSAFEEVLINWCGEERTTNHFCLSSKDTLGLIEGWNRFLENGGRLGEYFGEGFKYLSLNPRTLRDFGSFEFRTMRADEDWKVIRNWVLFVYTLCKYAEERYINPQLLANDLSERGGRDIFFDICRFGAIDDTFVEEVFDLKQNTEFERLVMEGFRRAQPIVMGHPWWSWMELITQTHIPKPFAKKEKTAATLLRRPEMAVFERPQARQAPLAPFPARWIADIVEDEPVGDVEIRAPRPRDRAARAEIPIDVTQPIDAPIPFHNIDVTQPIEFVFYDEDYQVRHTVPAEFIEGFGTEERFIAMATADWIVENRNQGAVQLRNRYAYETETGWWSGDKTVAQIRNVGSDFEGFR